MAPFPRYPLPMRITFSLGVIVALAFAPVAFAADARTGATVYFENCTNCHGDDGRGPRTIDFEGPALVDNDFIKGQNDEEIAEFLKVGRAANAPDNMLGVAMPPFSRMSPADMKMLVQYLRKLAESK